MRMSFRNAKLIASFKDTKISRPMKLLLSIVVLTLVSPILQAKVGALSFTQAQGETTIEIVNTLSRKHYKKLKVDDKLSSRLLDGYFDTLDPLKAYFTKEDITKLERLRYSFDDALLKGDLTPAFSVFNVFRERITDRLEENILLLSSDFTFDFALDESLHVSKEGRSWQNSKAGADDYWRKRMKDSLLRLVISGKDIDAARVLLSKRYTSQFERLSQQDGDDAVQVFVNVLTGLYDPHTSYLAPRILENFNIAMSLSLEGIGAVLQREDEYTKIVRIVPGGPADKQGALGADDKIIGVAQDDKPMVDVIGWRLDDVVALIRGKKDSQVRLEVISSATANGDKTSIISITRDKVKLEEQAAKSKVLTITHDGKPFRAGVITVPAFYMDFEAYRKRDPNFKSTSRDVMRLITALRQDERVDGIVLDLRNNGGGSLYEATALTDLFIDPGPVVQIRHANQRISREQKARQRPFYDGPLLVLINRLSASASEIFAGAIQDYGRGIVVGNTSFGKGSVQVLAPLKQGRLKLTESKFYRVSGQSTQHRGVIPDIIFPSYFDSKEIGESSQDNALPWDSIRKVDHRFYQNISPWLPALEEKHHQRTRVDPDWLFMLDEITLISEQRAIKNFSLNQTTRENLKTEREEKWLEIENQRRVAQKQIAFESVEAAENFHKQQKEDESAPDPVLNAASHLLLDYANMTASSKNARLAEQSHRAGERKEGGS